MGYTTDFTGVIEVDPPLNGAERKYLRKFNDTRRMKRERGPYYVDGSNVFDHVCQSQDADVLNYNQPPDDQPGLWCQWGPTEDGTALEWDGREKFYNAAEWMTYLIDHFLKPGGAADGVDGFEDFTFDHVCNGTIDAQGEDAEDRWQLVVEDNRVGVRYAAVTFSSTRWI